MCTNKNLFVDVYSLMTKNTIDEMKEENSFIELIHETNNGYKRECYNRNELLKIMMKPFEDTPTIWNNGRVDDRVKAVYQLPYTGEYIIEDAIRYLSCPWFKSFLKVECQTYELGTYFGVSTMHGSPQSVCKLVPIVEVTENIENLNFNDPSILRIQLPKIPEKIWTLENAPDEFPEEKEALQESDKSAPTDENPIQKAQRQNEVRAIARNKKIAELDYDDNKLEKETKIYKLDRLVEPVVLLDVSNPFDINTEATNHMLFQINSSFKYGYLVKERPDIPTRYSESYYFSQPKSPDEIFFNMDRNRIEKRRFYNTESLIACENQLTSYIDENYRLLDFIIRTNLVNGQMYEARFHIVEEEDMFYVSLDFDTLLEGEISDYQMNMFSFKKFTQSQQPINQFTKEQYIRIAGLMYLITHPILSKDLQPSVKSLITLLSMGIDIKIVFEKNSEYSNLVDSIDLYNNTEIHTILSRFDDYYNITKNLILFYFLEKEVFNNIYKPSSINESYPAILSLIPTNVLASVQDSQNYTALHYIIFNQELALYHVKQILTVLKDEFYMNFNINSPENLITCLLVYRKIYTDTEYIIDLTSLIEFLIQNGVDVNNCSTNISVLHRAIRHGDILYDVVKMLIDNGADINTISRVNYNDLSPLEFAQYYSELDVIPSCDRIIELLSSKGALKRSRYATLVKENNEIIYNNYKITDLIKEASTTEEINFVILNIENLAREGKIYETDNVNDTLMTALLKSYSAKNDLDKFKTLFETLLINGYDIDYKTSRTPIHLAIYNRLPMETINFMLFFNPDLNITGLKESDLPLTTCIFIGDSNFELFIKLIQKGAVVKPFIYHIAKLYLSKHNRCRNIYNYLLRYLVKPDIIQGYINRTTPLPQFNSSIKILDLFSVDQNNRNYFQGLLIGYASSFSEQNYFEIFKQLYNLYLQKGGDENYVDNFGNTVLTTAIINTANYNLIKYLIEEKNIDVHTVTSANYSLIDLASQNENYSQVVNLLKNYGVRYIQFQENIENIESENNLDVLFPRISLESSPPRSSQRQQGPPPISRRRR